MSDDPMPSEAEVVASVRAFLQELASQRNGGPDNNSFVAACHSLWAVIRFLDADPDTRAAGVTAPLMTLANWLAGQIQAQQQAGQLAPRQHYNDDMVRALL